MEEIDIHAKLAQIETAPHFSMIFDGDTEKAEMIAEHLMWLHSIRRERPLVSRPYKVGIYIRYFNQTRYNNYLDFHKKGFIDTIEIVALASGSRETPVWCMIYDDLCYAHEADIFANQMKFVKSLLPYEIFMANIEAKNPDQLMIRDLVESYGMKISAKRAPGHICAVSTLEALYKKYGYQVLNRVLRLIIATWEGDSNSFSANIMNAVAKLCVVYKNQLNDETFAEKVGAVSIKQLTRTARERRPGSMGYAEAMILEYNGKKKTSAGKLFMNKLYAKDVSLWIEPDEDDLSEEADEFESLILGQFGNDGNMDENSE